MDGEEVWFALQCFYFYYKLNRLSKPHSVNIPSSSYTSMLFQRFSVGPTTWVRELGRIWQNPHSVHSRPVTGRPSREERAWDPQPENKVSQSVCLSVYLSIIWKKRRDPWLHQGHSEKYPPTAQEQDLAKHSYRLRPLLTLNMGWRGFGGCCGHCNNTLHSDSRGHANFPHPVHQTHPAVVEEREQDIIEPKLSIIWNGCFAFFQFN